MAQQVGATAAPPMVLPVQPFASITQRFLAQVVDALVAFGVFFFTGMQVARRYGGLTPSGFDLAGRPAVLAITITVVVLLVYYVLAEALAGATLGKTVAGIHVVSTSGGRLNPRQALVRNILRIADGVALYLIGVIAIMATDRKQRLGDLAAGSVVLSREVSRASRITTLSAAVAVAAGGVVASYRLPGLL